MQEELLHPAINEQALCLHLCQLLVLFWQSQLMVRSCSTRYFQSFEPAFVFHLDLQLPLIASEVLECLRQLGKLIQISIDQEYSGCNVLLARPEYPCLDQDL